MSKHATLAADLRQRIKPAYSNQRGTESYERRECAEAIEDLIALNAESMEALTKLYSVVIAQNKIGATWDSLLIGELLNSLSDSKNAITKAKGELK